MGFDETVQKIKKLVPKAGLVGIGTSPFDREKMAPMQVLWLRGFWRPTSPQPMGEGGVGEGKKW